MDLFHIVRLYASILIFFLSVGFSVAQNTLHQHTYDPNKRLNWVKTAIGYLEQSKKLINERSIAPINKYELEDGLFSYKIRVVEEAFVVFGNGDHINIKCNSAHDNEEVGDVCVAIDQEGKIYINEGHVCGGLINFEFTGPQAPASASAFFMNFRSDTDKKYWKTYTQVRNTPRIQK